MFGSTFWKPLARLTGAVAIVLLGASMAACGSSSSNGTSGKSYTIALVPGLTTNPFYITMHKGAADEARKLGLKLLWQGGSDFTPQTQIPVVQSLLAQRPDALLISPNDETALKASIQQFAAAKTPVVDVDTGLTDPSLFISQVLADNALGGTQAADQIGTQAKGAGEVVVLDCCSGVTSLDQRRDAFIAEIKTRFPRMTVLPTQYTTADPAKAQAMTESLILAHPGLVGVFATEGPSSIGAGKGIIASGKQGAVFGVGYDALPDEVTLVKQNGLEALIVQDPGQEGKLAVDFAYYFLTGKKDQVLAKVVLPNIVATRSNLGDSQVSRYFYLNDFSG